MILRPLLKNLTKYQISKENKRRLLLVLLLVGMTFTNGCETSQQTARKSDYLIARAVPPFPAPREDIIEELKEICPKKERHKCPALRDWLGKMNHFHEQLKIYVAKLNEQ